MSENEKNATQLVEDAEKKLARKSGFVGSLLGWLGGTNQKDEAVEMFTKAANMFKMAKKWNQAANTFTKVANHHVQEGSKHDAATNCVEAANCYKKTDPKQAALSLQKAIDIYTDMGRFIIAAKHHQTVAELFECEVGDLEIAIHHYEIAADYFKGEESTSSATKCLLKVAEYAAQLNNYVKAIQIYEQVACIALQSNILKYSAKDHFFRASLCHLCVDSIDALHAVTKYEEQYPSFGDSREAKLIKTLCAEVENQDVEGFTEAVKNYDDFSRLETWYATLLLRVKKSISDGADLR